jgi:hypothetical protein
MTQSLYSNVADTPGAPSRTGRHIPKWRRDTPSRVVTGVTVDVLSYPTARNTAGREDQC